MNILDAYSQKVLSIFNDENVEYVVVGGYAVNYYGYRRTTGDIGLWIKPNNGTNKEKVLNALTRLGVEEESIAYFNSLDFTSPIVFADGEEPYKIDFMTHLAGKVDFDLAYSAKIIAKYDGVEIPFIHYKDLITSKISSSRLKDRLDVETLQKINEGKFDL